MASDRQRPHCLELYASGCGELIKACKTDSEGKVVEGKHTVYRYAFINNYSFFILHANSNEKIDSISYFFLLIHKFSSFQDVSCYRRRKR